MTTRKFNKTNLKHLSQRKIKTYLKNHKNHCVGRFIMVLKDIYSSNNKILIKYCPKLFSLFSFRHFRNISKT